MLDADLARFYGVQTRDLNKAVRCNLDRFPGDSAFMLTLEAMRALMFQPGTSNLFEAIRQPLGPPAPINLDPLLHACSLSTL